MKKYLLFLFLGIGSLYAEVNYAFVPGFSYTEETGFALGGLAPITITADSSASQVRSNQVMPAFIYTFKNQLNCILKANYYHGKFYLEPEMRYYYFPSSFYGIGNATPDKEEEFTNNYYQFKLKSYYEFFPEIFLGISGEWQKNDISDWDDAQILPNTYGATGGIIAGVGPAIKYDTRDNTGYPTQGFYGEAEYLFHPMGDYRYNALITTLKYFYPLHGKKTVLGFNYGATFTNRENLPFYKLPYIGGDNRLRGISELRSRDANAMYLQTELRQKSPYAIPLLDYPLGFVLFCGMGQCAPKMEDFAFDRMRFNIGGGVRISIAGDINLRIDYGFADRGQRGLYIGGMESF